MKIDFARRARALVGTRFRPQGRSPELGVDCVGLVVCTFALQAHSIRCDYRMRGDHKHELMQALCRSFRRISRPRRQPGDVLLLQVAGDQFHLGVMTGEGLVHADVRRGRVVESPGAPPWPIVAVYRRRARGRS